MFIIDGLTWDIKCDIKRVAEIKASEISGLMLDKSYFNDVLGTYMSYEITLPAPMYLQDRYATIYELLSNPADGHVFVIPYNEGYITITARVEKIEDVYAEIPGGRWTYWKETKFTVVANYPSKALTLGETVVAGRAPLPPVSDPQIGDAYTYTAAGWVPSPVYDDADDNYY